MFSSSLPVSVGGLLLGGSGRVRSSELLHWKRLLFYVRLFRRRRTVWPLFSLFIKPKIQTDRDGSDVLVKRLAKRSDCVMVPSPGLYRCLSSTFCPPRQPASPQSRAVTASSSWTLTPIIPPSFPKLATHTNARLLLCHTTSGFSLTSCQPRYESLSLCPPPSVSITFTLSFSL